MKHLVTDVKFSLSYFKDLWLAGKILHVMAPMLSPAMYEAP